MRALLVLLAACSPEIAPGAYFCGPERSCPGGQVCDGVDDVCVLDTSARPFACETAPHADETPATGTVLPNLTCVSASYEAADCVASDDREDWYQLDIPDTCTAVQIDARVKFSIAYQPLGFALSTAGGAGTPVETPCKSMISDDAFEVRCFTMQVTPGEHYAVGVTLADGPDCDGDCTFNRYALTLRLATP